MYSPDRLYDIWNLEIFLFGGIPEEDEAMFERAEDSFGVYQTRSTRVASVSDSRYEIEEPTPGANRRSGRILYRCRLDDKDGKVIYEAAE